MYLVGWGRTATGYTATILQEATLHIISDRNCSQKNSKYSTITNEMVCAAILEPMLTKHSACHGDSGGPLVSLNYVGKWELRGIVNWGSGTCNTSDAYTVFARVSRFITWIKLTMSGNKLSTVIQG